MSKMIKHYAERVKNIKPYEELLSITWEIMQEKRVHTHQKVNKRMRRKPCIELPTKLNMTISLSESEIHGMLMHL